MSEFINPFINSLLEVMGTMAQTQLSPGEPQVKKDDRAQGDVSGIIGMVGPQTRGSLAITFEKALALKVYERMLGEQTKDIGEEVTDMMGEITNMVTGGAKNLLEAKGYDFDMAIPAVVAGKNHKVTHQTTGPKILLPFKKTIHTSGVWGARCRAA